MNFLKKISFFLVFLPIFIACKASERSERIDWNTRPEEPTTKEDYTKIQQERFELNREVEKERAEPEKDPRAQEQTDLKAEKVKYLENLANIYLEKEKLIPNAEKEEALKKYEDNLNDIYANIQKLNQEIQKGYTPAGGGGTGQPKQGPGIIEKITLNLNKMITGFKLERALSKNDVVKSGELSKKLGTIYDALGKTEAGKASLERLNAKYRVKDNVVARLELYKNATQNPSLLDAISGYVNDYLQTLGKSEIEFGIKNKKNMNEVKNHYAQIDKILEGLGITPEQKLKLEKFRDESIANLEANARQINQQVKEFFDNKSTDNTVKKFNEKLDEINKRFNEETPNKLATYEVLKKDINYLEDSLQTYEDIATFQLDSLDQLYRTRVLSFLKNGYRNLEEFYYKFQQDISKGADPRNPLVKELYRKQNIIQEKLNNANALLTNELINNERKLEKTVAVTTEKEKNRNARPLNDAAKIAARKLTDPDIHLLSDFINELNQRKFVTAKDYFNTTIIKTMDEFKQQASLADSSEESIIYAQAILDQIIAFRDLINEFARTNDNLSDENITMLATFINQLEEKSAEIRQLWANNVLGAVRESSDGTPYILPKSLGRTISTSVEKFTPAVKDDAQAKITIITPIEQVEHSLITENTTPKIRNF